MWLYSKLLVYIKILSIYIIIKILNFLTTILLIYFWKLDEALKRLKDII